MPSNSSKSNNTFTVKQPPYYAVIFTSLRNPSASSDAYSTTASRMDELARQQPGFIGVDSVSKEENGITVSYWESLEAIAIWKRNLEHLGAQKKGKTDWYAGYHVRIARVEREYTFEELALEDGS